MSLYQLTHIDGEPLPVRLRINRVDFLVTDGSLQFEPHTGLEEAMGVDGVLNWEMRGQRLPETKVELATTDRHYYRRVGPGLVRFPFGLQNKAPEYRVEVFGDTLLLTAETEVDHDYSPARGFGRDRMWQFRAAPTDEPQPRWEIASPTREL